MLHAIRKCYARNSYVLYSNSIQISSQNYSLIPVLLNMIISNAIQVYRKLMKGPFEVDLVFAQKFFIDRHKSKL